MFSSLKKVFSKPRYITIAVLVTVIVFVFVVWFPNLRLIKEIIFNSGVSSISKISFLFSLFGSIKTNFSVISSIIAIIIAIMFGLNISLITYYIKTRQVIKSKSGTHLSIGGLISGILGIGCASCGTFLLTPILSLFGASGFLTFLPFGGEEFGLIGIGLLLYSSYVTLKKIPEPLVCEV